MNLIWFGRQQPAPHLTESLVFNVEIHVAMITNHTVLESNSEQTKEGNYFQVKKQRQTKTTLGT